MKLTDALKQHVLKTYSLPADASDELIRKTIGEQIAAGTLDPAEIPALSGANAKSKLDEALEKALSEKFAALEKRFETLNKPAEKPAETPAETAQPHKSAEDRIAELFAAKMADFEKVVAKLGADEDRITPAKLFGAAGKERVKGVEELYSKSKTAAIASTKCADGERASGHPFAGRQVRSPGTNRLLDLPSELDMAVTGAFWKLKLNQGWKGNEMPAGLRMTEHDRDLVAYALHHMKWTGEKQMATEDGGFADVEIRDRLLTPSEIKSTQLLDDGAPSSSYSLSGGTSGGSLVPLVFDDAIVTIPVLHGELFPHVDLHSLPMGRRIVSDQIANPTVSWGTAEGSAITPFTTDNFVTELDSTVYPIVGAFELGLDFMEDTPVAIGSKIIEIYGYKHLEALDNVIALGTSANSQPTGIIGSAGVTSISSVLGAGGSMVVGDLEALMFGVPKATRLSQGGRTIYFSNDTMYRRVRAIPQGENDARRVFGMTHADYTVMSRPYKVQNDIPDGNIVFANMAYYRMWRRRGLDVRVITEGITLGYKNTQVIIVRARWAGRPVLGSAFAVMTNAAVVDG